MTLRLILALLMTLSAAQALADTTDAYRMVERGEQGRVVYLIPGLASAGEVWAPLAEVLAEQGYRARVLTLAGFAGQPPLPGPDFLPEVHRQLAAELQGVDGPRPLLVGHSLGAFMAYWLAATEADRVAGVVAVDGLPFLGALGNPAATPDSLREQAEQLASFMASLTPEQYAQQNRMALASMISAAEDVERVAVSGNLSDPASVGRAVAEMMTTDLRPLMSAIQAPLVLIQAADSGATASGRQAFAEQIAAVPSHRHLVAESGRHFVQLDDPDFVHKVVLELLAELDHD